MANLDAIDDAMRASDTELYRQLGARAYLLDGELILKKASGGPERDEKNGRDIFEHLLPKIRLVICDQWNGCERLSQYSDETALAIAMADTFITNQIAPLPVATLAILTARIGIKRLCNCP